MSVPSTIPLHDLNSPCVDLNLNYFNLKTNKSTYFLKPSSKLMGECKLFEADSFDPGQCNRKDPTNSGLVELPTSISSNL